MIKMCWFYFLNENQRISLQICKDLGVGGCGLENPYGVRILNPLEIIGRALNGVQFQYPYFSSAHGAISHCTFTVNVNVKNKLKVIYQGITIARLGPLGIMVILFCLLCADMI